APSHALDRIELPLDTEVTSPLAGAVTIDARSVLAAGRITDSNGLPARGVPVTAYAYPSKITAEVGVKFELTPAGTTVTDSSGNYQIRTDTAALRPMAAEVSEALDIQQRPAPVNVDIIAGTGNAMTSYATTVWATPDLRQAHVAAGDLPVATVGIVDETR